jgi:hypothetical protein
MPRKAAKNSPQDTQQDAVLPTPFPEPKTPQTQKFRLSALKPREVDLQAQICDWLQAEQTRGRVAWFCRVNGGMMQLGHGRIMYFYRVYLPLALPSNKGYADLHGMLVNGRYFALEVKRPGEKETPEQSAFLNSVRSAGGIAAVVRGFKDVARVFAQYAENQ